VKAYLVGGLSWFAIPFTLATTMGLAGIALESSPSFPGYPNRLSSVDVDKGLVVPAAATALLGPSGAVAVLILVFMAVTSAASAELIAVSSIFTYDIFRTYIKPGANGKQVVRFSHMAVISFGLLMGVLAVILNAIGISLNYLYSLMGVISSPAVVPIALTLTWRKQSSFAAISGCVVGLLAGVGVWLGVTRSLYVDLTIDTTGKNYPMLAGNLASLIASGLITVIISLLKPDNFDFNETKTKLQQLTDDEIEGVTVAERYEDPIEHDEERLKKATRFAVLSSVALTIILVIIWPIPMYLSHYIFSPAFFTFWVAISMIWALCATVAIALYPIFESRAGIVTLCVGMINDLKGLPPSHPPQKTEKQPEKA
jgi:Na+/proline symporter